MSDRNVVWILAALVTLLAAPGWAEASEPRRMTSSAEVGNRAWSIGVSGLGGGDPMLQQAYDSPSTGIVAGFGYGRTSRVQFRGQMAITRGQDSGSNGLGFRGLLQQNLFSVGPFLLDYAVASGVTAGWLSPEDSFFAGEDREVGFNNSLGLVVGAVIPQIHTGAFLSLGAKQRFELMRDFEFEIYPTAELHLEWRIPLGENFSLNPHIAAGTFVFSEGTQWRPVGALNGGISLLRVR